jgi:hypothetical protein
MKIPKLKRFYTALTPDQYREFERSRELVVDPAVTIDITTGAVTGRTSIRVCANPEQADTDFRLQTHYTGRVYVLALPADVLDRTHFADLSLDQVWNYTQSVRADHCGVLAFDLQKS